MAYVSCRAWSWSVGGSTRASRVSTRSNRFSIRLTSVWQDLSAVRLQFPDADQFKSLLIFNVRHNNHRLIVKVDYRAKLLMAKEFLTHKEYTRGGWKKWAR